MDVDTYDQIGITMEITPEKMTHLKQLEAESIHIMREVAAEFDNPVMLYSVGKDSSVMLHLAQKSFCSWCTAISAYAC